MAMPLDGIRILDWTVWQQGPTATALLADMGADVIKIEEPRGDPGRGLSRIGGVPVVLNYYFGNQNRNKRGIILNLKTEAGRQVLYKLAEKSDVFVTNFRSSIGQKLGVDYHTLVKFNPKLIYAYSSGWGPKGPDSDKPAFDLAGQARSGIMSTTVGSDGVPHSIGGGLADEAGGVLLAYGIMLALFARERTGIGQEVDVSLLGSMVEMGRLSLQQYLSSDRLPERVGRTLLPNPLWNVYRTQDDKWLCLAMLQTDRFWPDLCKALGIEELEKDTRFESHIARAERPAELIAILDKVFITKTRDEWLKLLDEHGIIAVPVSTYAEVANDPQVLANDYIVEVDHPQAGPIKVVGIPVKLSKTPGEVRTYAPEFGQHTEEVLMEVCGYTWEDIAELKNQEAI